MCPVPTEALSVLCIRTKFSKFLNKKQKRFFLAFARIAGISCGRP